MKKYLKSKKVRIACVALMLIFACSLSAGTLAVYMSGTDKLQNHMELGNVTTEIEEEFKSTKEKTVFEKKPIVTNTGENDCYVRARVNASPEEQLDITGWDTTNWVYNAADGFYYYQKVLKAGKDGKGDKTSALFTQVAVKKDFVDTIEGFEVNVYQEAVQSTMNAADGTSTTDMTKIWQAYDANQIPATFNN